MASRRIQARAGQPSGRHRHATARRWTAAVVLAAATVVVGLSGPVPAQAAEAAADPTTAALEQRRLEAEIRQIEQDTAQQTGFLGGLLRFGPLATAVAAVGTAWLAWNKHLAEEQRHRDEQARQAEESRRAEQRQREEDRRAAEESRRAAEREREADRRQQEAASLRRFDEAFAQALARLGSDSEAVRVSGAASLRAFLKPRYAELTPDVLAVIVANLKIDQPGVVRDLLRVAFERAMRLYTDAGGDGAEVLDLARTKLARVDLEGVDLGGLTLDVAFADLSRANLTGLDLRELMGYGTDLREARLSRANLQEARLNAAKADRAQFHGSRLVSATFRDGASLRGAEFHQAHLQSAHFEGADLSGAHFEQSNVSDTFFTGATFDDAARQSLLRSRDGSWRKAHLDADLRAALEAADAADRGVPSGL